MRHHSHRVFSSATTIAVWALASWLIGTVATVAAEPAPTRQAATKATSSTLKLPGATSTIRLKATSGVAPARRPRPLNNTLVIKRLPAPVSAIPVAVPAGAPSAETSVQRVTYTDQLASPTKSYESRTAASSPAALPSITSTPTEVFKGVRIIRGALSQGATAGPQGASFRQATTSQQATSQQAMSQQAMSQQPMAQQAVSNKRPPQTVSPLQEFSMARAAAELAKSPTKKVVPTTRTFFSTTTAAQHEPLNSQPSQRTELVTWQSREEAAVRPVAPRTIEQQVAYPAVKPQTIAYQPDDFDDDGFNGDDLNGDEAFDDAAPGQLPPQSRRPQPRRRSRRPLPDVPVEVQQRPSQMGQGMPFEVVSSSGELTVTRRRNKILRSEHDVYRVAVVDPSICDVVQFTPREVSVIGKAQGATNVTFWFADGSQQPVTYLVRVVPDPEVQIERERQYQILEEIVAELFPDSKVRLVPVADKLIVRGQAKGAEEAAQIMAVVRGEAVLNNNGSGYGSNGGVADGRAAAPLANEETGTALPAANVINMLRIPGVQQVALKVKIAELNRSAAREFGVDLDLNLSVGNSGALVIQTLLNMAAGSTTSISGSFDNDDINFGIHYLQSHDVVRILSEPTLVTLSGRPASFLAGGEFAVPTVVGVEGASAVTTDFRSFGVLLNFLPTVIDKDRIRLEISPEFSQIDSDLEVDGTPGLNTRAVTTTVEMREGQAFAIAGLLEDSMSADTVGDLPWLAKLLGRRSVSHNETELLILVTPELVHPLEPEAVPPLPGFDVTEPTNKEFFWHGDIEGRPTREYRSTIWPRLRSRYRNGGPAMISGPFGHGQ